MSEYIARQKKPPKIQFIVPVDDSRRIELTRADLEVLPNGTIFIYKPEYIYRVVGILNDSINFCTNDDNFKRNI
ncbi:hypothetical protein [Acinetobacter celticus]|uniref:hypothetical protein n=1 Tax=Acinetobacter celticus TaxID=1891224 RepID=UPI0011462D2F